MMVTTTQLRILRHRHRITLKKLQQHCGFSGQSISQLEFGRYYQTPHNEQTLNRAIQAIITSRRESLAQLELDYSKHIGNLLQPLEVDADEF